MCASVCVGVFVFVGHSRDLQIQLPLIFLKRAFPLDD